MATPDRILLTEADIVTPSPLKTALDGKAASTHASQHATGGADAITPESIGALGTSKPLAAGQDLNLLGANGLYWQGTNVGSTVALGYPEDGFRGYVEVSTSSSGTFVVQRATYVTTSTLGRYVKMWVRTRPSEAVGYTPWVRMDSPEASQPFTGDLNDVTLPGKYVITSGSLPNLPISTHGHLEVMARDTEDFIIQRFTSYYKSNANQEYVRTLQGDGWTAWVRTDAGAVTPASIGAISGTSTPLGSEIDLDTLDQTGLFARTTAVGTTLANHYPRDNWAGYIRVTRGGSQYVLQEAFDLTTNFHQWFRTKYGTSWGPWTRVDAGAATPASIGAAPASRFLTGTGSPEGVTAAPVGTTYTDTATGNEWHKMSGTGVTGWRGPIVLADDPRLISSVVTDFAPLVVNGWTVTQTRLERSGFLVTLSGYFVATNATNIIALNLPAGYRPSVMNVSAAPYSTTRPASVATVEAAPTGTVKIYIAPPYGTTIWVSTSYRTTNVAP